MVLKFTKMHGLGNDFMVIDAINQPFTLLPQEITSLSARNTGIGFDQCLIVEASKTPDIDFFYRIFNADGQEVGQCGNGARCLARFVQHYGLTHKECIRVATRTTLMQLQINADKTVRVDMGLPKLQPADIPVDFDDKQQEHYQITLPDHTQVSFHALSVGNPHAVLLVDNVDTAAVNTQGKLISEHPFFPEQTNVGFMEIVSDDHIRLRVYERGCGETLACGSGAVAAVAIGRLFYNLAERVRVTLPGGDLIIDWPDFDKPLQLTGSATFVYEGELMPCAL